MAEDFKTIAAKRLEIIEAGFSGDADIVRAALTHASGDVRSSALSSLHRLHVLSATELSEHVGDVSEIVRRNVAQIAADFDAVDVVPLLTDLDVFVAEMAAWALGERNNTTDAELFALIDASENAQEQLVREAATASLGAIGDVRGLPAILRACTDKPAIRRRAVLALAPFEGVDVDTALENALTDRDWQVRQNAQDMLNPRDGGGAVIGE
ncbi:MAG: hypothetical protein EXQ63_04305 [Ilumatobacteraceae bacterium]|nr:hypothetical protein [Ilumatobacteraceae bacterium]